VIMQNKSYSTLAHLADHTQRQRDILQYGLPKCGLLLPPFRLLKPSTSIQVNWRSADALNPHSYAHLLPGVSGVVHTLGTLLEDTRYKEKLREGDFLGLVSNFISGIIGHGGGNPLENPAESKGTYEVMNRDAGKTSSGCKI
jgi:hypothetical protein